MTYTVAQDIAATIEAMHRCEHATTPVVDTDGRSDITKQYWQDMAHTHAMHLTNLCRDHMPSGSGFDCGTELDFAASSGNRLVFITSFHHMDENGFYDGWTEHRVTVRPAFSGYRISVSGSNRNDIKELIHQEFDAALDYTLSDAERQRSAA